MRSLAILSLFLAILGGPIASASAERWPVRQYQLRKTPAEPKTSIGRKNFRRERLLEGRNKKPIPMKRAWLKPKRGR